jgi:hypothetical protein
MASNPILKVKLLPGGVVPFYWSLPPWHDTMQKWIDDFDGVFFDDACSNTEECTTDAETLRAACEKQVRAHYAWGNRERPLSLEVYGLARNIESECGSGSPEERAAILFCAVNRAKINDNAAVIDGLLHKATTDHPARTFGKQIGDWTKRPVSTAQRPRLSNILIADFLWSGIQKGTVQSNIGDGAVYLDAVCQDIMHRQNPAHLVFNADGSPSIDPSTGKQKKEGNESASYVFTDWSVGGDFLTWAGLFPGIRPDTLCIFNFRRDLRVDEGDSDAVRKVKSSTRDNIRKAGLASITGRFRTPLPWRASPASVLRAMEKAAATSILKSGALGDGFDDFSDILGEPLPASRDTGGLVTASLAMLAGIATGAAVGAISSRKGH